MRRCSGFGWSDPGFITVDSKLQHFCNWQRSALAYGFFGDEAKPRAPKTIESGGDGLLSGADHHHALSDLFTQLKDFAALFG